MFRTHLVVNARLVAPVCSRHKACMPGTGSGPLVWILASLALVDRLLRPALHPQPGAYNSPTTACTQCQDRCPSFDYQVIREVINEQLSRADRASAASPTQGETSQSLPLWDAVRTGLSALAGSLLLPCANWLTIFLTGRLTRRRQPPPTESRTPVISNKTSVANSSTVASLSTASTVALRHLPGLLVRQTTVSDGGHLGHP